MSARSSRALRDIRRDILLYLALAAGTLAVVYPFLWMIISSFKTLDEFYVFPPRLLPKSFALSSYESLFTRVNFARCYLNSIEVTLINVAIDLVIVTMAGYGFAKYDFRGKGFLFALVLATTMVPWVVTIIPLFIITTRIRAVDTFFGLVFPGCIDVFGIFLARNFMQSLPTELIQSARIDGAGEFRIFRSIILPLVKPLVAVLTINKFVGSWNSFQWPLLVVGREELRTIPLAVAKLSTQFEDAYDLKMAAATLAIIPVLAVYVAFQKYFVSGISLSGIKG